ncbi:MAG: fumarylacetoacetate hydrolase family protein [Pseudomonadota bacterium]
MPESPFEQLDARLRDLLHAWDRDEAAPAALHGHISMDEAYALQLTLLDAKVQTGAVHTGWKVGQTAASMRAERGESAPAPGYLLASVEAANDGTLELGDATQWFLEPELALTLGTDLGGPAVSPEQAHAAVASACTAFELVHRRPGWDDRALQRAVNGSNAGYILGTALTSVPTPEAADALRIQVFCDDHTAVDVRGGDVNDNPLGTLAWLATFMHEHGRTLRAGETILTGTYAGLMPVAPGQSWQATVGDLPPVAVRIA